MAIVDKPFPVLRLPIEVRWVIYKQLLSNFSLHPCQSVRYHTDPIPQDFEFFPQVMDCSRHDDQISEWSSICSLDYSYKPSDLRNLMLVCKRIHLELEPLLWTNINLIIGLPRFYLFFRQHLTVSLRSAFPNVRSRHQVLQKLTLVLPRLDLMFESWAHPPALDESGSTVYVREAIEQALTCLRTVHPDLQHVAFVVNEWELQPDARKIIPLPYTYLEWMLHFKNLKHCTIIFSGARVSQAAGYVSKLYRRQLGICEQVLKEMITSTAADPIEAGGDCPTHLIEQAMFDNIEAKPILREYCERVARRRNQWWESLSVKEQEVLVRDEAERRRLRREAQLMERWMLANQI
jgi:hypothetical protein